MPEVQFTDTGPAVAREVPCAEALVRLYGDLGLLRYRTASNGVRLYPPGTAEQVREIKAQRLKNRGGNRRTA